MRTLIGMVTIGPDTTMRRLAVARAQTYAARHGYDFHRMDQRHGDDSRTPHWEKLLLPKARPGYDRYAVIDDDILINHRVAPPLPAIREKSIGLVREPLPSGFTAPVEWIGNTGFMLTGSDSLDLLDAAYAIGECKEVPPGYGDQPAVNLAAWRSGRVTQLDREWNYLPMADWLIHTYRQKYPWTESKVIRRVAKTTLALRLLTGKGRMHARITSAYLIHLTWFRHGAPMVDKLLG